MLDQILRGDLVMQMPNRRALLRSGAGLVAGGFALDAFDASPAGADVAPGGSFVTLPAPSGGDDAPGLNAAISAAPQGTVFWFQSGSYNLGSTLVLKTGCTYRGTNPGTTSLGTVLTRTAGASLTGNALVADTAYVSTTKTPQSGQPIVFEDITIQCQYTVDKDVASQGLVLMTYRSLVRRITVLNPGAAGIVLSDTNSAGALITNTNVETRIEDCAVYTSNGYGFYVKDTNSSGKITDGYLLNCITSNTRDIAFNIRRAAGWFICNNHAYGCQSHGFWLSKVWDSFVTNNEADHFGQSTTAGTYYGFNIDSVLAGRPSQFIANIASTTENKAPRNAYQYFRFRNSSAGLITNLVLIGNVAHQDTPGGVASTSIVFVANAGTLNVRMSRNLADGPAAYTVGDGVHVWDDPDSLVRASGDILAGSAAGTLSRVPVGADGTYLRADSSAPAGVSFGSPAQAAAANAAPGQVGDTFPDYGNRDGQRVEVMSRRQTVSPADAPTVGNGDLYLTYFTPDLDLTASHIEAFAGTTDQSGASLVRYGLYAVDDDGDLTCVARTANDTTLGTDAAGPADIVDDGAGNAIDEIRLQRGQRYAFAVLVVGASTEPTMLGRTSGAKLTALSPRSAGVVHDQDDLPATVPNGDVEDTGIELYASFA